MLPSERPVILLGHGVRAAGVDPAPLLELGIPILTSWQAKDLVDNFHPNYYGCPGQYGNRAANKVFYEADQIIAIGNRMSIWNVGYEGPRPDQQLIMVDCDANEVEKFKEADWWRQDIGESIRLLSIQGSRDWTEWGYVCAGFKHAYPLLEVSHSDSETYINSYRFTKALEAHFTPTQVITTDCGAVMCPAFQVLQLRPPQRLLTSGGLGEMGCGIPAAIGASFATNKGPVLALIGDGGMMLNLQELQTIIYHKLPIKIIVYENDGYGMIKRTQSVGNMQRTSVDSASGVSFPDFRLIAGDMCFRVGEVRTWDDFNRAIPALFASNEPSLVVYHLDPEQAYVPKLDPIYIDGKPTSPRFCDMSPPL